MASDYTYWAWKMIMTGEEDFISAMKEDRRWSGGSEVDRQWWQVVLGERAMWAWTGGSMSDILTVLILNGTMEGQWVTDWPYWY